MKIGPNTVSGDLAHYDLHLDDAGVVADLWIDVTPQSWRPGAGLSYFDKAKTQKFAWVVPVPFGTVTGTITVDGETRR